MNGMNNKQYKAMRLNNFGEGTEVSRRVYNLIIAATVAWGIVLNIIEANLLKSVILSMSPLIMILLYFLISIPAIIIIHKSSNPGVSFAAFSALAIGMGLLLTFIVSTYTQESVVKAFIETGIVCLVVGALSSLFPNFFAKLGRGLFITLLIMIIVEFLVVFLFRGSLQITSIAMVIIFSGFFGYDLVKAQSYVPSVDNAIDSAADIYVDVINIFIRLLEIFGRK